MGNFLDCVIIHVGLLFRVFLLNYGYRLDYPESLFSIIKSRFRDG